MDNIIKIVIMVGNANEKYNQLELGGRICMGMVHYIHNIVKKKSLDSADPFPLPQSGLVQTLSEKNVKNPSLCK